jgi:hypothetical protein
MPTDVVEGRPVEDEALDDVDGALHPAYPSTGGGNTKPTELPPSKGSPSINPATPVKSPPPTSDMGDKKSDAKQAEEEKKADKPTGEPLAVTALPKATFDKVVQCFEKYVSIKADTAEGKEEKEKSGGVGIRKDVLQYSGKCNELMSKMDLDEDGVISIEEFQCYFVALHVANPPTEEAECNPIVMAYINHLDKCYEKVKKCYINEQSGRYGDKWAELSIKEKEKISKEPYQRSCGETAIDVASCTVM